MSRLITALQPSDSFDSRRVVRCDTLIIVAFLPSLPWKYRSLTSSLALNVTQLVVKT